MRLAVNKEYCAVCLAIDRSGLPLCGVGEVVIGHYCLNIRLPTCEYIAVSYGRSGSLDLGTVANLRGYGSIGLIVAEVTAVSIESKII